MTFLLDTDISSYIMKRSDPAVLKRLKRIAISEVGISAITKSELEYGVEVSPSPQRDRVALDEYLRYVEVLDYPSDAAKHYGQIRAALKEKGSMIGANDLLIAAHARCLAMILVTNNTREFGRVPGLKLQNWTRQQ
jgi:tRNA(fMet)-specific endonuclease VapC